MSVDELIDDIPDAEPPVDDGPVYVDVEEFVTRHLAPLIQRQLRGAVTWCPQWWRHPEAVDRLTALWQAWEHFQRQPAPGQSTWWLAHADPHLAILLDADRGPFVGCTPERGHDSRGEPLPCEPRVG